MRAKPVVLRDAAAQSIDQAVDHYVQEGGAALALRFAKFPYLVFYLEREDHVDVLEVLHGKRDIPVWLQDGQAPERGE
jgi:toxin ParE1/3/4